MNRTIQALFLTTLITGTQCNANPRRVLAGKILTKGTPDYVVGILNMVTLAINTGALYMAHKANKISEETIKTSQIIKHLKKLNNR